MPEPKRAAVRGLILSILLVLLMAALAYLPLIGRFGFYKDDWHMIYSGDAFGWNRIAYAFESDRPLMGKIYAREFILLGDSPLAWQVFALGLRAASALGFAWLLHLLWPKRRLEVAAAAVLFIIYPGFLQQPNANTFQNHFMGYAAAIFSMVFALLALRLPRWWQKAACVAASMAGELLCLGFYEYMIGLEAVKWALLAYWLHRERPLGRAWPEIKHLALTVAPYAAGLLGFLYWRFFIFKNTRPATDPQAILNTYRQQPVESVLRLIMETGKDWFETIFAAWVVPLYQLAQKFNYTHLLVGLLIGAAGVGLWQLYRRQLREAQTGGEDDFGRAALALGGLAVLLAVIPVIVSNRNVVFSDQFDRYTLHATLGAALFLAGGIASLKPRHLRTWLMGGLIALALTTHFLNSSYWAEFWNLQRGLWQQLAWRAPQLQDDTLLMAQLPSGYRLAEDYEIFSPANLIYSPGGEEVRIKGEILLPDTLARLAAGDKSPRLVRSYYFERDFSKALVISWTDPAACVHVQDAARLENNWGEEAMVQLAAPYSRVEQIVTEGESPLLPGSIFGPQAQPSGWCYYYQRASLARQQGDWDEAVRLADEARTQNLQPVDVSEWLPMLEGYLQTGRAQDARVIAGLVRQEAVAANYLCAQLKAQPDRAAVSEILCKP